MAEEAISLAEFLRSLQKALKSEDFTDFNPVADKFVRQAGGPGLSGFYVKRRPKPVRKSLKECPTCGKGVKDVVAHTWRAHSMTKVATRS